MVGPKSDRPDVVEIFPFQPQSFADTLEEEFLGGFIREVVRELVHVDPRIRLEEAIVDLGRLRGRAGQAVPKPSPSHGARELGILQAEGEDGAGRGAVRIARFPVEHGSGVEVLERDLREGLIRHEFGHLRESEGTMLEDDIVILACQDHAPFPLAAEQTGPGRRNARKSRQADEFKVSFARRGQEVRHDGRRRSRIERDGRRGRRGRGQGH